MRRPNVQVQEGRVEYKIWLRRVDEIQAHKKPPTLFPKETNLGITRITALRPSDRVVAFGVSGRSRSWSQEGASVFKSQA